MKKFVLVKDAYYIYDKRKQKTVGTLSNQKALKPFEQYWIDYIFACSYPLFYGNKEESVEKAYKYDILKVLLAMYSDNDYGKLVMSIIAGMTKYLVRKYDLPVEELKSSDADKKHYDTWVNISQSDIVEYDGTSEVPKEYY